MKTPRTELRRSEIKRSTWIKRGTKPMARSPMKTSAKPLAARGAAKAKREKKYDAYMRSAAWKRRRLACIAAAGGRCTASVWSPLLCETLYCAETENLVAHHLTYARFGNELPEDLRCLCRSHHNELHALEGKRIA